MFTWAIVFVQLQITCQYWFQLHRWRPLQNRVFSGTELKNWCSAWKVLLKQPTNLMVIALSMQDTLEIAILKMFKLENVFWMCLDWWYLIGFWRWIVNNLPLRELESWLVEKLSWEVWKRASSLVEVTLKAKPSARWPTLGASSQ